MKKLVVLAIITLVSVNLHAQGYKRSALKSMNKTTLTEIYLDNVIRLYINLPYTAFTLYGKDSSNYDAVAMNIKMDIPTSEYFNGKRTVTLSQSVQCGDVVKMHFYEILPYADKSDLIESILYLQKVNNDIKPQKRYRRLINLTKLLY